MGVFAREVIRKLICVSGKGAADDWHGGGTETKGQKSFSAHNQGGAMPQKIKKGRMINMKMKKFLSSLTAGVMAATTVFTSALVTPVMSFIATAADADAIGTATLVGVVGANTNWEADVNATSITGDGEYTVSWNLDSASDSISFLTVQISKAGDTENFTTDTFKDLKVSLSSVSINGEEVADAVKDDKIVDTAFYEGGNAGTTRIYLNGSWAGNHAGALDNFDTTKVENGISKISVTFTVEGTGKTTTTTTSETTAETTETTVSSAVSSDVSSETSESVVTTASASSAETVTTTTAPAIKDVEAKITTGTQKGKDGDIQAYAEFDPNGAKSATLYYTITSKDTESSGAFGTYNGDWFQEEFKASVGANGACTADYTIPSNVGKTVKAMIFYPDASSVKIDKVVLHYDSAVTTSATTTSVTTTTEAAKYTKVLTPKAEEDKGTDGKASNTKVEFDPMGAYKAIAYYTVKTNDTNTSGAFGTWNDSLPEGEEWQSEEFKDLAVPANKQVVVSYNIPKTVGETVQFMVYYPKFGDVTIDKIVLCFDEDPDATTTSVSSTTEIKTTASSVSSETETTASATTKGTESSASETTKATETSATSATTETDKATETSASATTKDTESSATSATTKTDKATETSATEKATTVTSTTKQSVTTTATDAPKGKGIVIDIGEANAEPGAEGVELPFYLQKYIPSEGFSFAIDVPMVTAKILSINKTEVSKDGVDEYVSGSVRRTSNTAGFEAFGADESAAPEDRWMYFMWTVSAGTATIPDEENGASNFMNMYFDIADNAADVAAEYGLELQTDADGNTYYFFPMNFAQYQKVNWDFSGTAGSAYIMPNQQFLDDSSNDLATTDVTYYNGGFRVYTDKKDVTTSSTADTTTSITTTKTTATDEKDMPINLDIDEVYVYPQPAGENPDYVGIEEELGVKVIAKEGVDTKSYGISGAVAFPDATAKLFTIPDGMESKFAVNDFGSSGRPNMIDFAAYKNGTSTITDGSDRWIRFIEAFSNDGPQDPAELDRIFHLVFDVPDADTVQAIADEYGLTLQTGEYDGKTVQYYEFPVTWAPDGIDQMPSGGTIVDVERFKYLNGEGVTGEDIFDDQVGLKDGAIRVIMKEVEDTTTTTTTVTTTTTTKASTTTTKASATTTTKASTTSTTKASVTTTTKESTTTTKASATTTTKASTTTTEEATSTTTTEKTTVSETSGTTTTKATESEAPVSTTTVESTTTERGTFTKKTTTVTTTTEDANYTKVSRPTGTTTTETTTSAENTTTSSETTTSTGSSSDTVTSTTTTETQPAGKPDVKVKEDANFYLSEDTRAFDPADLVESATLDGEDILSQLTFEYASPKDMYDALHGDIAYVASDLKVLYNGEEVGTAKVYIGIKGDTDLNGKVEATDMFYNMYYQARLGAGIKEGVTLLENNQDENLEKLSYFLTDIDTESKEGKNTADKSITPTDLFYQMYYIALKGAGYKDTVWTDVFPDLKNLQGSCWYEAK